MMAHASVVVLKEKMRALKNLYVSRHYTQCANYGERLLREIDDRVRDSIHDAADFISFEIVAAGAKHKTQGLTNNRSIPSTPLI
jgi:hypothetical protein